MKQKDLTRKGEDIAPTDDGGAIIAVDNGKFGFLKISSFNLTKERKINMIDLEGKKAPNFNLLGSDGKNHSIKDYQGKNIVIYFYPKDNTPGCTKESCGFRRFK